MLSQVDVDAFTGIEIQEWPARIAEVAMWLMDHQMNIRLSEAFGQYFVRLPLRKSANIVLGNALRLDWKAVLPPEQCSYVLGNPPFIGKQFQDVSQKADMKLVWGKVKGAGVLDYVTCWYAKAADYIQDSAICVGFVSTNSISQGEQVGVLWNTLFQQNVKIHFAYRTFAWASEARGKAHVHVVIIGFGCFNPMRKRIYECDGDKVTCEEVENINPYLVEGNDVFPVSRSVPLCPVPNMMFGSMPNDGGNLLLSDKEAAALEKAYPAAAKWIRPFIGSEELINGCPRACLWLVDVSPHEIRNCSGVLKRVEAVRDKRSISTRAETQALAKTPALFGEIRQPTTRYLAIPKTSSERRAFIPIAFLGPDVIASTEIFTIPDATLYHFGILTSTMHMAWMRQVCGRIKSDYRYSAGLVYNNFPWPRLNLPMQEGDARVRESASRIYWSSYHESWEDEDGVRQQPEPPSVRLTGDARKIAAVEAKAKAVLDVRARHPPRRWPTSTTR